MRLLPEESVGLVIDIQERLFPHITGNEELLRRTKILLEGLKHLGVPVLVTEQYRKGLGNTVQDLQVLIENYPPVEKTSFSCCDEPLFLKELNAHTRKNVLICGIETHVCVLQTTVDLIGKGYLPVVVEDCVSSRNLNDKYIAIERMRYEGAVISTVESLLFELARVSGTETFKAISRLVK